MALTIDLIHASTAAFTPTPAHELLARFVGVWQGPTQLWLDPKASPEEGRAELQAELLLGGRWLRIRTRGFSFGKPHAGEMLLGYHKDAAQFELAWIDSAHTGSAIMWCTGPARDPVAVDVVGSYLAGEQRWGWRMRLSTPDGDGFVHESFNISPDGVEERAIITRFGRV